MKTPDFRKEGFKKLRELVGRILWKTSLRRKVVQESWSLRLLLLVLSAVATENTLSASSI